VQFQCPRVLVIAVVRRFVQFLSVDLSVPSVCGGFLGASSEECDLRCQDRCLPPICAVAVLVIVGVALVRAVAVLVIVVFRWFVQSRVPCGPHMYGAGARGVTHGCDGNPSCASHRSGQA
jgi:hypothetical protein